MTHIPLNNLSRLQRVLFLASSSPRRFQILQSHDIPFTKIPNLYNEPHEIKNTASPRELVRTLCKHKARASQSTYKGIILGVDTIVVYNNMILGKPRSLTDAQQILSILSGKTHAVYTGICLLDTITKTLKTRVEYNTVSFKPLTQKMIQTYIHQFDVLDKAGSYGIQDCQDTFAQLESGSYYSVMGFPIDSALKLLEQYDIVNYA